MDGFSRQPALEILERFDFTESEEPAPIIMEFAKAARAFAGISPAELSEKRGVEERITDQYENHGHLIKAYKKGVALSTLIDIAHTCGLNIAVIVAPKNAGAESEKPFLFSRKTPYMDMCKIGGKIFIAARELHRENQIEFGKRLNICQAAVSSKENGYSTNKRPVLPWLSSLLDMAKKSDCRLSLVLCHPEVT